MQEAASDGANMSTGNVKPVDDKGGPLPDSTSDDTKPTQQELVDRRSKPDFTLYADPGSDNEQGSIYTISSDGTRRSVPPQKFLQRVCSNERPLFQNLQNSFGDSKKFLIQGDSLVLELVSSASLDWECGGQFLHFIYLCERYLLQFLDKGGEFYVVFFDDFRHVFNEEPTVHLAGEALRQHLRHSTRVPVVSFRNPWDPAWRNFVAKEDPTFVLTSSGGQLGAEVEVSATTRRRLNQMLRIQHVCFRALLMNCAYISGLQVQSNHLMGFFVIASSRQANFLNKVPFLFVSHWQAMVQASNTEPDLKAELLKAIESAKIKKDAHICPRLLVGALACGLSLTPTSTMVDVVITRVFLLHLVLLDYIPLKARAVDVDKEHFAEDVHAFLCQVKRCYAELLSKLEQGMVDSLSPVDTETSAPRSSSKIFADIMDGRLFLRLLQLLALAPQCLEEPGLPSGVTDKYLAAWEVCVGPYLPPSLVQSQPDVNDAFPICPSKETMEAIVKDQTLSDVSARVAAPAECQAPQLLPIDCPLVDEFIGDIKKNILVADINSTEVREVITKGIRFDEHYHWHSGRPIEDDADVAAFKERLSDDPWQRKRQLKAKQKFSDYILWYGQSLEGGLSWSHPIIVQSSDKNHQGAGNKLKAIGEGQAQGHPSAKAGGKGKKKQQSSKDKILEENKKKKEAELNERESQRWDVLMKEVKIKLRRSQYEDVLVDLKTFLESCKHSAWRAKALVYRAEALNSLWRASCNDRERNLQHAVDLFSGVQDLVQGFGEHLTAHDRKKLAKYMIGLGFTDTASTISTEVQKTSSDNNAYIVGLSSSRFQLRHLDHLLRREGRDDPDPRVSHFIPDDWQRELLDVVDNNQSALIVAPTSSGKTFASYYCMEKVLRDGNDGVVVYVSPTKALCNQVQATVYARFSRKKMPAGRTVCGVFTRDHRQDVLSCQVLVTVPQCLEILMLSPRRQEWVARLKYVIFDEVHCLGSEIGAEVWEHLLTLIRCPFLALSATISNPEELQRWFQNSEDIHRRQDEAANRLRTNSKHSYNVQRVVYNERYCDLQKFKYVGGSQRCEAIHPVTALTPQHLSGMKDFPADLSLAGHESLELYDAMETVAPGRPSLLALAPEVFFKGEREIIRPRVRAYEHALKQELMDWVKAQEHSQVSQVIQILKYGTHSAGQQDTNVDFANVEDEESMGYLLKNFLPLLDKLDAEDKLPAIVFSYNRDLCEVLANVVVSKLMRRDRELRESPELNPILGQLVKRRDLEEAEKQRNRDEKPKEVAKREGRRPEAGSERSISSDLGEDFGKRLNKAMARLKIGIPKRSAVASHAVADMALLYNPLPGCTFANVGKVQPEELERVYNRLRFKAGLTDDDPFMQGLKRGICWHHAGCNNKLRSAVEMLFRMKHMKVVIATGTLALGIHMPCRTVILAGDSPYITPLSYRQMAGRAGRRGYDLKGDIIFFGMPQSKISLLMSSNLPKLEGNFPITPSSVLRMLVLCSAATDKQLAVDQCLTLLENPLMCVNQPQLHHQIKHHFFFCLQFLMRQGVLDEKGQARGLAGLTTHLHYHEPANFVMVYFLQQGLFHKLCQPGKDGNFSEYTMRELVLVLSNLFGRRPIHEKRYQQYVDSEGPKNSKVKLEPLPDIFQEALKDYNDLVGSVFDEYLQVVSDYIQEVMGEDTSLPLSNLDFTPVPQVKATDPSSSNSNNSSSSSHSTLLDLLVKTAVPFKICSAFAALSGHTDTGFSNDEGVFMNLRHDIYCEQAIIPQLPVQLCDRLGNPMLLNAYALDFYKHGSQSCIVRDNSIQPGEVWHALQDFQLVIKSISTALEQLGPEEDNVVKAFHQLQKKYAELFHTAF